jgi:hypothetical protein
VSNHFILPNKYITENSLRQKSVNKPSNLLPAFLHRLVFRLPRLSTLRQSSGSMLSKVEASKQCGLVCLRRAYLLGQRSRSCCLAGLLPRRRLGFCQNERSDPQPHKLKRQEAKKTSCLISCTFCAMFTPPAALAPLNPERLFNRGRSGRSYWGEMLALLNPDGLFHWGALLSALC